MVVRELGSLNREDRVIMVAPRGATISKRCLAKKIKLYINEGVWLPDQDPLNYANYYQAQQISSFVTKNLNSDIFVYSYSNPIALTLEIYLLLKQNKSVPAYVIGDAISGSTIALEGTKPELWLAVLLDEVDNFKGDLTRAVEDYLATGVAVSSKAKIIEETF